MTKVAVIYYSATGNIHALAEAVAEGAMGPELVDRAHSGPDPF
jgi:flavodoxin